MPTARDVQTADRQCIPYARDAQPPEPVPGPAVHLVPLSVLAPLPGRAVGIIGDERARQWCLQGAMECGAAVYALLTPFGEAAGTAQAVVAMERVAVIVMVASGTQATLSDGRETCVPRVKQWKGEHRKSRRAMSSSGANTGI